MRTDEQLKASLKEIGDLKAALDEHAIVAITNPQGRITYVNDKFCAISKYGREELIGQDHRIINSGYHPPEFIQEIWTTIGGGRVWHGEIKNRAKDGTFYWVETTIVPFLDDHGKPRQYVAIRADITARKLAEEAARESERRFRMMADHAPVLIWVSGTDKLCTWFNQQWLDFVGRTMEQEKGNGWAENVHPDDLDRCLRIYTTAFDARVPFTMEYRMRRRDGAWRWLVDNGVPRYDAGREFAGYIGSCIDVTDRKLTEENLRASTKEVVDLKAALDEHAIVAITDPRGKITYVNDKFCAISQYSRDELIGQDHRIINSGYHPEDFIRDLWTTVAHGRVWHGEIKNKAKDGTFYWVDTTIVPFLNEHGKPRQYVAIRADITERKQTEEKIGQLNANLEQRVAERTAQFQAANKELEAFSYSVSHDLRAPLRAVDGFSQAVLDDYGAGLPEEGQRYLRTIRSSAQRMGALIDDLLAFSRLSRHPLEKRSVNMAKLVHTSLHELGSPWEDRRVEVNVSDLPQCQGEPALLKQVWVNLLSNALKYTRKQERAEITIGCRHEKGSEIYFVKDNGSGFDMKYAGSLFGVFQRLHRMEEYEGTGVGLAIVQRIVQRHGGRVWAEAEVNKGATFYFTLENKVIS
jgi:PAS domain S-box-containing protein